MKLNYQIFLLVLFFSSIKSEKKVILSEDCLLIFNF